jgi:carboxymethylenebutenolidase
VADVTIKAADGGSFSGYLSAPAGGKGPGILVIQEIFGVNKVMRDLADGFAAQGYVALCPDLFWRQEPGIQLTDKTDAEWARAFQLYQGFDEAKGVDDLKASLAHLRGLSSCTGKVGSVGYCLGGKLAYLMATRSDADANVGYYGVGIEKALAEAAKITKPLMLHIAEKDEYCPPAAQQQIKAALGKNPRVTPHSYPGMDHAFARAGGQHYDKSAAETANRRTAEFFKANLGG